MDGGLATRRFALQISDPFKNPWRDFSYLIKIKERMDARLSSMQNCAAILQYSRKSMEGFSSSLPKIKERMDARLSNTEICLANLRFLQKSMEGFLKDHTPDWSGGRVACNPLPFPQGNGARRRGTTESG